MWTVLINDCARLKKKIYIWAKEMGSEWPWKKKQTAEVRRWSEGNPAANIKTKSVFYGQTMNFCEHHHKNGRRPLHWYLRLRAAFRPLRYTVQRGENVNSVAALNPKAACGSNLLGQWTDIRTSGGNLLQSSSVDMSQIHALTHKIFQNPWRTKVQY